MDQIRLTPASGRRLLGSALGLSLALGLNATPAQAASSLVQHMPSGTVDWSNRWIEVNGSGLSKTTGNPAQERLLAQRAALADAYRQLTETVYGVRVDAETVVRNYVTESDVIKTRVDGVVKGARQIGEARKGPDGETVVTLRMPIYGQNQLSDAIDLDQHVGPRKQSSRPNERSQTASLARLLQGSRRLDLPLFPAGLATGLGFAPVRMAAGGYTGLVLDMCTLPIQPVMSPAVFGDGQQVYIGNFPIDPDQVVNEGVLQYFGDYGAALESPRVGSNPLVVEAIGTNEIQTDILVSPEDAERIRLADESGQFLKDLKVVVATSE